MTRTPTFSESQGFADQPIIQHDSMNTRLRNDLWNYFYKWFIGISDAYEEWLWTNVFGKRITNLSPHPYRVEELESVFNSLSWNKVYDVFQIILTSPFQRTRGLDRDSIDYCIVLFNKILEQNSSAWRFHKTAIISVSDAIELEAIGDDVEATNTVGLKTVRDHLNSAIAHLSKKPIAEVNGVCAESLNAVEALAKLITRNNNKTLSANKQSLKKTLPNANELMIDWVVNLYNRSSTDGGCRHGNTKSPVMNTDDARFILVFCSAVVNNLVSKSIEAGIEL